MYKATYEITHHGFVRAKERCNMKSVQKVENNVRRALERGRRSDSFSSWERSYMEKANKANCSAVAYNGFCYIFNEFDQCITILNLPAWFGKKRRFDGKVRIRNYKQYCADKYVCCEQRSAGGKMLPPENMEFELC